MEINEQTRWPNDAYILVGMVPRDTRSRFKHNTFTDYIANFSSSFFKFHELTNGLKDIEIIMECVVVRDGIIEVTF